MNTPTLETERLILRKFTKNDLAALFEIYRDEEVNTYLPWYPLKSMEEAKKSLKKDMPVPMHSRAGTAMRFAWKALGMSYKYSYEELWQPKNYLVTFRMYQLNFDGNNERVYKEYWNKYENHFVENGIKFDEV